MTTAELRAAAKRAVDDHQQTVESNALPVLQQIRAEYELRAREVEIEERIAQAIEDDKLEMLRDNAELRHDQRLGLQAWLAEHPEDEDVPIDAEWLNAVGKRGFGCWLVNERWAASAGDGIGWSFRDNLADSSKTPCLCVVFTRGDVRRLCAALGLPLKETR